ncbi:hypothetical protein EV182_007947, partial [Spiromyces aspiralis]
LYPDHPVPGPSSSTSTNHITVAAGDDDGGEDSALNKRGAQQNQPGARPKQDAESGKQEATTVPKDSSHLSASRSRRGSRPSRGRGRGKGSGVHRNSAKGDASADVSARTVQSVGPAGTKTCETRLELKKVDTSQSRDHVPKNKTAEVATGSGGDPNQQRHHRRRGQGQSENRGEDRS